MLAPPSPRSNWCWNPLHRGVIDAGILLVAGQLVLASSSLRRYWYRRPLCCVGIGIGTLFATE